MIHNQTNQRSCIYSIELLSFKAEELRRPLIQLFSYYGLPYNCSFRHALLVLESIYTDRGLREYALKLCQELAIWEDDFKAVEYHMSPEKVEATKKEQSFLDEIKRYTTYLMPSATASSRITLVKEINSKVHNFLHSCSVNFIVLAELYALLPAECRVPYIKQKLFEMTIVQLRVGKEDEIQTAFSTDNCFDFIRRKLKI